MFALRFFSALMSYTFAFLCFIAVSGCQNVLGEGSDLKHDKTQNAEVARVSSVAASRPSGIFISGGQYQEEPLLAKPFVDGALIRVRWHELEPIEGQFDWRYLDSEIAKVAKLGKAYTLAVVGGPSTPSWVFAKGAQGYSFTLNNPYASKARPVDNKLPLPWDAIYLKAWHRLIAELGKRYSSDPNLLLVHITLSSQNGFEMHLPYSRGPRDPNQLPSWDKFGFSEDKYINAAKTTLDAYSQAFPTKFLDLEIHNVFDSYRIPQELVRYGVTHIGKRFGPFGAWLNDRDVRWDKPLRELMKETSSQSFCNYQLIGNATRQLERVGKNGLQGAIQNGLDDGCRYFEVWEVDVKNRDFEQYLTELQSQLKNSH